MVTLDPYISLYNGVQVKISVGSLSPVEHRRKLGTAV